jgi:hypothetical protein
MLRLVTSPVLWLMLLLVLVFVLVLRDVESVTMGSLCAQADTDNAPNMHVVIIIFFMFSPPIIGLYIYAKSWRISIAVIYGRDETPAVLLLQESIYFS